MSSNIEIQRICEYCKQVFTAKTTKTKYCSHKCNSRHYKELKRQNKIIESNIETKEKVTFELGTLNTKDYLTVSEVATLLNCSKRSVYQYINKGNLNTINLGDRLTRIKRSDIDNLFKNN